MICILDKSSIGLLYYHIIVIVNSDIIQLIQLTTYNQYITDICATSIVIKSIFLHQIIYHCKKYSWVCAASIPHCFLFHIAVILFLDTEHPVVMIHSIVNYINSWPITLKFSSSSRLSAEKYTIILIDIYLKDPTY